MLPIKDNTVQIDEMVLHKANAAERIKQAIDIEQAHSSYGLVKYASLDKNALVELFVQMLKQLNLHAEDAKYTKWCEGEHI
jgi:hypothetical protein